MPNASHLLETALLFLVAFVIGAVIGTLARRLTLPRTKPADQSVAPEAKVADGPQLVVAPTIAPLPGAPPRRSAAERLAAAAGRDLDDDGALLKPSRTAGDATAGIIVPPPAPILAAPPAAEESATSSAIILPPPEPAAPAVLPEAPAEPVSAADVPPIDEAAQVIDRPVATAVPQVVLEPGYGMDPDLGMPVLLTSLGEQPALASVANPGDEATPDLLPPDVPADDLDESAAMRAIEGGDWRPRRAAATRPVPLPEQAGAPEIEQAMANTRSAVASATAAAAAAIAESEEAARERRAAPIPLDFDAVHEAAPQSFLDTPADVETSGLQFEPKRLAFGQPEGLPAPRDGQPDNLRQIKTISPQLESSLHQLGIYHFDQIANWDQKASHWVDTHLSLKGRLGREKWIEQARDLSAGRAQANRPVRR